MGTRPASPISQLLSTLGVSREELFRRSQDMRKFLSSDNPDFAESAGSSPVRLNTAWLSQSSGSSQPSPPKSSPDAPADSPSPITPASSATEPKPFSMEAVIERQRRSSRKERRSRKDREKLSDPAPAALLTTGSNLNPSSSSSPTRQNASATRTSPPSALTPQQAKYYRPHTTDSSTIKVKSELEAHDLGPSSSPPSNLLAQAIEALTQQSRSSLPPTTPAKKQAQNDNAEGSSLPSSPPPGSPSSSPLRAIDTVSSPAPSRLPLQPDWLPYKLPPGPYSNKKPDLSYAAMIGQAILSSPDHRLTLQELYDWITTVYPYYTRGESTWMNSIRHVLSTTITFRKMARDRSVGRTLWAIWDEDIPCFADGGFKKYLCKDYVDSIQGRGPAPVVSTSRKPRGRKREVEDNVPSSSSSFIPSAPPLKKARRSEAPVGLQARTVAGPSSNKQSYYDACLATAASRPSTTQRSQPPAAAPLLLPPVIAVPSQMIPSKDIESDGIEDKKDFLTLTPQSAIRTRLPQDRSFSSNTSSCSQASVPELTPHRLSSSPPPSNLATSEADIDDYINVPDDDEDDAKFRLESSPLAKIVPGSLLRINSASEEVFDSSPRLHSSLESPSLRCRGKKRRVPSPHPQGDTEVPCTPPRFRGREGRKTSLPVSPHSTPISHRGVYMSPSTSLAHYKSHLDPPPKLSFDSRQAEKKDGDSSAEADQPADDKELRTDENFRTPSQKRQNGRQPLFLTPRRLPFPSYQSSPFRTPGTGGGASGGGAAFSSLTPWRGGVLDPYDASAILDEEMQWRSRCQESPAGIGVGRHALLYQSPGAFGTPGEPQRFW